MPKLHDVKPHPAFNIAICPRYRTMGTQPFGSYQGKTGQPHYPHSYLENLMPVARTIDAPHDVAGVAATTFVGMMGSMLIALLNPTWLFDSMGLGLGAFLTSTRETIYLRRVLLMATLLGSHGLAGAFAAHLRGLLFGTDQSEMVHCKIGEWQSHTAHQQSLLQAFKPAIFTRILLMFVQGFTLFFSFIAYLVYPPLCLSIDRHLNALAIQVHTDVLTALDKDMETKEGMFRMNDITAPAAACWFWSMPPNTPFRDVILAMRADDTFHTTLNEIGAEIDPVKPAKEIEKYLDTHVKGQ